MHALRTFLIIIFILIIIIIIIIIITITIIIIIIIMSRREPCVFSFSHLILYTALHKRVLSTL